MSLNQGEPAHAHPEPSSCTMLCNPGVDPCAELLGTPSVRDAGTLRADRTPGETRAQHGLPKHPTCSWRKSALKFHCASGWWMRDQEMSTAWETGSDLSLRLTWFAFFCVGPSTCHPTCKCKHALFVRALSSQHFNTVTLTTRDGSRTGA